MYVNGGSVIVVGVVFPVLGSVAVLTRFVVKVRHQDALGADDWLCLPALAIVLVTGALMIYGSAVGAIGYHSPPYATTEEVFAAWTPQQHNLLVLEEAINVMSPVGTGLIRLSFLFFYRRIFRGRVFNTISWTLIGIIIAWMTTFTIGYLSLCGSNFVALFGTLFDIRTNCVDSLLYIGIHGITGFVLDLSVLTMPFFWIWRVKMIRSLKLAVTSVFLCGIFSVAAGGMRMTSGIQTILYKWGSPGDILGYTATNDLMGDVSIILFWQYVEQGTGLIVCCLPAMRPFAVLQSVQRVFHHASWWILSKLDLFSKKNSGSTDHSLLRSEKKDQSIIVTHTVDLHTVIRNGQPISIT